MATDNDLEMEFRPLIINLSHEVSFFGSELLLVSCFLIARLLSAVFVVTDLVTELKMTFTFSCFISYLYIYIKKVC